MTSLGHKVEQLMYENATDFEIAKVIKEDIKIYFDTLPELFSQTGGKDFLVKHTYKIDTIIKLVYKISLREMFGQYMPMKNAIPIAIAALGSYGREQLCVHSDIDLMIVYEEIEGYQTKALIEKMLYLFWDIGLKLGHRVHELSELPAVARSDITIKSAILESRFIEGSRFLWTGVENKIILIRKEDPDKFIREKLEEQRLLHQRFPLTMEPNLKEGVGGFRDANLVYWIGKLLYNVPRIRELPPALIHENDYKQFRISLEFLFRVRSALHLVAGKKEDRLRLELIPEVASKLGYEMTHVAQMRFAKKTTESLRFIHMFGRIWLEALIKEYIPDYYAKDLLIPYKNKKLYQLIRDIGQATTEPFTLHPQLLGALYHAKRPEKLTHNLLKSIREIFDHPSAYSILKALSEARLLKYIIPPIKKVVNLPQFDGYHTYSVDIHSLRALYHLENLADPFLQTLYDGLDNKSKSLLKIATFLHDAGKGRKRDHAQVGASLFRLFAGKLKLDKEMILLGEHLILHHDLMSVTAQREDLYNEKTILQFASQFNSKKRLDMIYLLTYADMNGVGKGVYTSFRANLLKTLYRESIAALQHDQILDATARKLKKISSLKRNETFKSIPKPIQKKILSIPSNEFFIRNPIQRIIDIGMRAVSTENHNYFITNEHFLTIEIIRKTTFNLGYLLSKLSRLNVIHMEVTKLFDGLKYFKIDFNETIDVSELPLVEEIIHTAFDSNAKAVFAQPYIQKEEIEIDCNHSRDYGVMRLRTKDQKGLLAYIIHLFDTLKIDIVSTKIHTSKYRANDLFLIEKDGNFCHNIDYIIQKLTEKSCAES